MKKYERVFAIIILSCFAPWISALEAATPPSSSAVKQKLELFGVGAEVRVKLGSGEELKGFIGAIDANSFDLIARRGDTPQPITYDGVTELKLAQSTYRASGPPDATEVKRVVAGLGVERHVAVKVTSGKTFRGHLHAINEDDFVLLLDKEARPMKITYSDVQQLGPNLSKGAKIGIGIAAVAAAIAASIAVFGSHSGEGPQPTF